MIVITEKEGKRYIVNIDLPDSRKNTLAEVSFSVHEDELPNTPAGMDRILSSREFGGVKGMSRKQAEDFLGNFGCREFDYFGYGERTMNLTNSDLRYVSELVHSCMKYTLNIKKRSELKYRGLVFWPCNKKLFVATKRIVSTFVRKNKEFEAEYKEFNEDGVIFVTRKS